MASSEQLSPETVHRLEQMWHSAFEDAPTSGAQAQLFGFNLRLNLGKAFAAVSATAVAIASVPGAILLDPLSLLKVPASVLAAVSAGIAAVYEKMVPAHYVACLVLADYPEGLTREDFESKLRDFLRLSHGRTFPWYLGLSTTLEENGFNNLIEGLKQKKYVEERGGRFSYAVQNFVLGLSPD